MQKRRTKFSLLCLGVGLSISGTAFAAETEAVSDVTGTTGFAQCSEYLNVRSSASQDGEIVGKLYNNGSVEILDVDENGWYHIHSGNVDGYVASQYIATGTEADEIAAEAGYTTAEVGAISLNVRAEADEASPVVGAASETEKLEVVADGDDWVKVVLSDGATYGYVSTEYVYVTTEYPTALTLEEDAARQASQNGSADANSQADTSAENTYTENTDTETNNTEDAYTEDTYTEDSSADNTSSDSYTEDTSSGDAYYEESGENTYYDDTSSGDTSENTSAGDTYTEDTSSGDTYTEGTSTDATSTEDTSAGDTSDGTYSEGSDDGTYSEGTSTGDTSSDDTYYEETEDTTYQDTTADDTYTEDTSSTDTSSSSSSTGQAIANYACQFVGNPYVWGGTSLTSGADCSGFVLSVFANFGISLPHSAAAQAGYGTEVSYSDLQPGDLLFYSDGSGISHVAIYIGGGSIVHAANSSSGICYSNADYSTPVSCRRLV